MVNEVTRQLKLQHDNGSIIAAQVKYWSNKKNRNWTLEFTSSVFNKLVFTKEDVFECLTELRRELAKYSCQPLCNGARLEVYPSRMARDMGDGLVAETINSGLSDNEPDLVDIFDYAEPELIASVEEQFNYYGSFFWENITLKIQHDNGSIVKGNITKNRILEPHKLTFTSPVTPDFNITNTNEFAGLIDLRQELARLNYRPLCNGARLDTYVLPVDIEVYDGIYLHILTLGKIPNKTCHVYIFDYAEPSLIASTEKQRKHYEFWLDSIKYISFSEYGDYGINNFPELYFRTIGSGEVPLMWLFDIDLDTRLNLNIEINQSINDSDSEPILKALSPLSPKQVEQIGSLKGEAIIGFITGHFSLLSLENFYPNKVFKDFMQNVISTEAPKDPEIQAVALEQQEGWIYIVDRRVSGNPQKETSQEDILGAFEIKDGRIVANSYQPNKNYLIFGENGLFQLPDLLHQALIGALEVL